MDWIDEPVSCDSELLEWFEAQSFIDLSIAMSCILKAEVFFPDGEETGPDDSRDILAIGSWRDAMEADYPMTIAEFLQKAVYEVNQTAPAETWRAFEADVLEVERIPIRVWREPFAPWDSQDDLMVDCYPHRTGLPDTATVASLRRDRLDLGLPYFHVDVLRADGRTVPGQTRLGTIRRAVTAPTRPDVDPTHQDLSDLAGRIRGHLWVMEVLEI